MLEMGKFKDRRNLPERKQWDYDRIEYDVISDTKEQERLEKQYIEEY